MNINRNLKLAIAAVFLAGATGAHAHASKDVVLDTGYTSAAPSTPVEDTGNALTVTVLGENPQGYLGPRSTEESFRTGERFRLKVLSAYDGLIEIYNTNPIGQTTARPIWRGPVQAGIEAIGPRLRLDGYSGHDQVHVVLTPRHGRGGMGSQSGSQLVTTLRISHF